MNKPELRFMAVLLGENGSAAVLYDDNDLDIDELKEILKEYGEKEDYIETIIRDRVPVSKKDCAWCSAGTSIAVSKPASKCLCDDHLREYSEQ